LSGQGGARDTGAGVEALLNPKNVVIVGATDRPGNWSQRVWRNLKRYDYPSELKIGVMKPVDGRLEAHAWLESGGIVVIGDFQLGRYVPLVAPDGSVKLKLAVMAP